MLNTLDRTDYSVLLNIKNIKQFPLISSVINKKQGGKIFVDNYKNPQIVFIIHKSNFSYLYLCNNINKYDSIFRFFEKSEDLPKYFYIYSPPLTLYKFINKNNNFNFRLRRRIQLRFDISNSKLSKQNPPFGYKSETINERNYDKLKSIEINIEKFWKSKSDFLTNGFAIGIFDVNNDLFSLCYSACISDGIAEIDIMTNPNHHGKGLATYATSEFINLAISRKITPNWDCFEDNYTSLAIALRTGFNELFRYDFLSVYFPNKKEINHE